MRYAASAPTLASGANIGAFNLGNALGAFAGGVGITAGLGYTSPIWAGAVITLAALAVMAVAAVTARRTERADAANAPRADAATTPASPEREPAASVA
jgi:DHA1 family inner membrane transport protein